MQGSFILIPFPFFLCQLCKLGDTALLLFLFTWAAHSFIIHLFHAYQVFTMYWQEAMLCVRQPAGLFCAGLSGVPGLGSLSFRTGMLLGKGDRLFTVIVRYPADGLYLGEAKVPTRQRACPNYTGK